MDVDVDVWDITIEYLTRAIYLFILSIRFIFLTDMCSLCWLVRWFRDWPFVYFSGGFISHLFGDYANINMWKSDYMKAWNSIRNDCGRFVKNQMQRALKNKRYQETGKEYFTTVQMIVKDEGYKYFAAKATFDAWSCPPSPPSAPQTHTHTRTPT